MKTFSLCEILSGLCVTHQMDPVYFSSYISNNKLEQSVFPCSCLIETPASQKRLDVH